MRVSVFSALAACSFAFVSACNAPNHVSVSGSTTVLPAVSKAAEAYKMETGHTIVVNAGGSGSGFNQVAEGQTDIGMMSRDITAHELAQFSGFTFTPIPIGQDAVVPVVSSEVYAAGVTQLSLTQIASIYKGEVDNWSEFGGPNQPIFVIDKETSSGTRQTFMEVVMGGSKATTPGADLVIGSNNEEQTAVTQSDAAIGMLSHAWLNDDVKGLAVTLPYGDIIEPTLENVKNGQFPITRDLNVVVRNDIRPEAKAFVDYLLSDKGQGYVVDSGYLAVR